MSFSKQLNVGVHFDAPDFSALTAAVAALGNVDIGSDIVKAMVTGSKEFSQTIGDAVASAERGSAKSAAKQMQTLGLKLDQAGGTFVAEMKAATLAGSDQMKKDARANLAQAEKALKKELDAKAGFVKNQLEAEKKAKDDLKGTFSPENAGAAFGKAKGGDMGGMAEGVINQLGKAAVALGGALGVAAGAVMAVVGAVALAVKIMIDAEAQAKEFNTALMTGAGTADMINTTSKGMSDSFRSMRRAATDLGMAWRTAPKDMMVILATANEAGLTFKEMEEGVEGINRKTSKYKDLLSISLTYSKVLGATTTEIAETTGKWHHDFGMGLKQIEESFAAISVVAQQSGMSTKRFFSMVSQATSGLAIYNNRIEETAAIILDLASVIGEDLADSLAKDLTKGFMGDSYQERIKKGMIAGKGDSKEIFELSAKDQIGKYKETFSDPKIYAAMGDEISHAIQNGDYTALGNMDSDFLRQQTELLRITDDKAATALTNLISLSKGATGGMSDRARGMGALDTGGTLAFKLQTLGNVPLSEMDAKQLIAFENYAGISGEALEALIRVDSSIRGQYGLLEKWKLEDLPAKFAEGGEEEQAMIEQYGATIRVNEETGEREIVKAIWDEAKGVAVTGEAIKNLAEYIQSNGDLINRVAEEGVSEDQARAMEVARQTASIATLLEVGVQYWLERIYGLMESLYDLLNVGVDDTEQAAVDAVLDLITAQETQDRNLLAAVNEEVGALQAELDELGGKDPEKRAELEAKMLGKLMDREGAVERLSGYGDMRQEARASTDWIAQETPEEVLAEMARKRQYRVGVENDYTIADLNRETADIAVAELNGADPEDLRQRRMALEMKRSKMDESQKPYDELIASLEEDPDNMREGVEEGVAEPLNRVAGDILKGEEDIYKEMKLFLPPMEEEAFFRALKRTRIDELMTMAGIEDGDREAVGAEMMKGDMSPLLNDKLKTLASKNNKILPAEIVRSLVQSGQTDWLVSNNLMPDVRDFIYQRGPNGGRVTPIHSSDQFVGMLDGEAIDQSGALGGGGSGSTVNINVRSPTDMARVYEVVKQAVGAANGRTF